MDLLQKTLSFLTVDTIRQVVAIGKLFSYLTMRHTASSLFDAPGHSCFEDWLRFSNQKNIARGFPPLFRASKLTWLTTLNQNIFLIRNGCLRCFKYVIRVTPKVKIV